MRHALLILLLMAVAAPAVAQTPDPRPAPRYYLRTTTLADAYAMETVAGVFHRRTFVERIELNVIPHRGPWTTRVSAQERFDLALPARVEPWRDDQLTTSLQLGYLQYDDGTSRGRVGRLYTHSPISAMRVDGLDARAQVGLVRLELTAGVRPETARWSFNDNTYAPDGDPDRRAEQDHRATVAEVGIGVGERDIYAQARLRESRSLGSDETLDRRWHLGIGAREDRISANASAVYAPLYRSLARGDLDLRVDRFQLGARWRRPIFPTDSPFSVYPLGAHGDLWGALRSTDGRWTARLGARARGRTGLVDQHLHEALPGGALRWQGDRLHGYVQAFGSAERWRATAVLGGSHTTESRLLAVSAPLWRHDLSLMGYRDPRWVSQPSGGALAWSSAMTVVLGQWAALTAQASLTADTRAQLSLRTFALLDIWLRGGRGRLDTGV